MSSPTGPDYPPDNALTGNTSSDGAAPSHGAVTGGGPGDGTSVDLTDNDDGTYTLTVG